MKLSKNQKEVIKLMREGWEFYTWRNEVKGRRGQLVYSAREYQICGDKDLCKSLHHSVVRGLQDKKILQTSKPYYLTELGKTINID